MDLTHLGLEASNYYFRPIAHHLIMGINPIFPLLTIHVYHLKTLEFQVLKGKPSKNLPGIPVRIKCGKLSSEQSDCINDYYVYRKH